VTGVPPGTLFVVATPIGNLGDLSPRAAEVLRAVRAVVAEDTRRTLKIFAHLAVPAPPLLSLPAFDERGRLGPIVERLRAGEDLALCTDAGTPAVSDPGAALVAAAWEAGARVVPVPGPSAALAALAASGFAADRFLFAGFLPRKGGARADALRALAAAGATVVLYEAGNRTRETLQDLREALGDRPALVARELTKLHEELARGTLADLAFSRDEWRGEIVIVLGAQEVPETAVDDAAVDVRIDEELARGSGAKKTAEIIAAWSGRPKREIYERVVRRKK